MLDIFTVVAHDSWLSFFCTAWAAAAAVVVYVPTSTGSRIQRHLLLENDVAVIFIVFIILIN